MSIDSARVDELHIVRQVREIARRWWSLELSFTDAAGSVVDHSKGIITPPGNPICAACLGDPQGFAACNRSIQEAVAQLAAELPAGPEGRLLGPCHMGLDVVAAAVDFDDRRHGTLFACGFLVRRAASAEAQIRGRALEQARRLVLPVLQPEQAFEEIARIDEREFPRLADLLSTTVAEIAAYEQAVGSREKKIEDLRREISARYRFDHLVGKSEAMQRVYRLLDKIVESEATVLVTGENGTGKELIARALHHNGPRKERPFVAQNCAALNDNLLESELFGHVRGAFTGAARDKTGLFRLADGGTFFLDELGDMSPAMQVKLLRVLQEGTFVPVGGTRPEKVDVRIIAATNKDLREMVARRQFREDLFYRLCVLQVQVPPLRERLDDLPFLTEHFLAAWSKRHGKPRKRLSPALLASFYERSWPGNVRELQNEIERLSVLSGTDYVIGPELMAAAPPTTRAAPAGPVRLEADAQTLAQGLSAAVERLERALIGAALEQQGGNRSRAAQLLQVSRTTLLKKIRDYGIEAQESGKQDPERAPEQAPDSSRKRSHAGLQPGPEREPA